MSEKQKTGELRFSFDDGESIIIGDVFDCEPVTLTLKQDTKRNNIVMENMGSDVVIQFTDAPAITFQHNGRRFSIFVRDVREEKESSQS